MTDLILGGVLILVMGASVFFTWTLVGLVRSHVPFISTSKKVARKMVALAHIKRGQKIYDLGCGRGVILFEAIRFLPPPFLKGEIEGDFSPTQFIGYELVRPVVWWANIRKFFVGNRYICSLRFQCKDFFKEDLSDADVIFCYLWPSIMDRFYAEKWKMLKKGTKIISHGFRISALTPKKIEHVGRAPIFVYEK